MAFVAIVHLAFLTYPLRVDEAGLALVGHGLVTSNGSGHSLYGNLWIDRPPLLVLLYGVAQLAAGSIGIRLIGLVAAVSLVAVVARLARELAGPRPVGYAAGFAALLASSPALGSSFAYPELVAAPLVAGAVLTLAPALLGRPLPWWRWLLAGALAATALLIKQSFLDGIVAVVVAAIVVRVGWRAAAALAAGLAAPIVASFAWAQLDGAGAGDLAYAMLGFRIDGLGALASSEVPMVDRFAQLGIVAIAACVPILLPLAVLGLAQLRRAGAHRVALVGAAWVVAAGVGVLGGG